MKDRTLSKNQRAKFNKILANKGKEAADAFKKKIADGDDTGGDDTGDNEGEGSQREPRKRKDRLSKSGKAIRKDIKESTKIGNELGLFDEQLIDSPGNNALIDPTNPAFIKNPSEAEKVEIERQRKTAESFTNPDGSPKVLDVEREGINILLDAAKKAGIQTPDMVELVGKVKKQYDDAGVRTPEMKDALNVMKQNVTNAGLEDERVTRAAATMEQGLMGYDEAQNQRLREKSQREVKGKLASAQRNLEDSVSRNRVTGGASLAAQRQLDQMSMQSADEAEQDLLAANVDVQDKRRNEFADYSLSIDEKKKAAVQNATSTYGTAVANSDKNLADDKLGAGRLYADTVGEDERSRRATSASLSTSAGQLAGQVGQVAGQRKLDAERQVAEYIQKGDLARAQALNDALGLNIDVQKANAAEKAAKQGAKVAFYTGTKSVEIADKTADATIDIANQDKSSGDGRRSESDEPKPDTSEISGRLDDVEKYVEAGGDEGETKKKREIGETDGNDEEAKRKRRNGKKRRG